MGTAVEHEFDVRTVEGKVGTVGHYLAAATPCQVMVEAVTPDARVRLFCF